MSQFLSQITRIAQSQHDLSARQVAILWFCGREKSAANRQIKTLADHFGWARPVISRAADKLEEAGFVERSVLTGDRRTCVVSVTPAGQTFIRSVIKPDAAERVA